MRQEPNPTLRTKPANLLDRYQRCSNTLRRLLESLGLQRRTKDVTLIEHDRDEAFRQEILQVLREDEAGEEARP